MALVASLLCSLIAVSTAAEKVKVVDYSGHKVIRVFPRSPEQVDVLRALEHDFHFGIDVWGETLASSNTSATAVDLRVIPRVYDEVTSRLDRSNVRFNVTIDDLQRVIDTQRAESEEHRASVRQRRSASEDSDEETTDAIVGMYASYNEINSWMATLRTRHPQIVELIDIGSSYEGRRLVVIKIGQQSGSSKPAIWIDAGIHAREWIAPATAVYLIHALVSGYTQENESISQLIANYDWYILPVLNPDGYEYSNSTDRMWRKTRSRVSNSRNYGCVGVDANRNFDFHWLSECGGRQPARCRGRRPCENVFAGRHALSEPETIAVANFIMQRRSSIRLYISLHCYSQLWLTPWGYTSTPPSDNVDLLRVANRAVDALEAVYNTDYGVGSPAVILYSATGGSYDWAKGVAGIKYSYTIELRDRGSYGFVLPISQILPTGEETWAAVKAAVQEMGQDECWVRGRNCS